MNAHTIDWAAVVEMSDTDAALVELTRATDRAMRLAALRAELALCSASAPSSPRRVHRRLDVVPSSDAPPPIPTAERRPKLLLVEDNEQLARLACSRLEHAGFDVDGVLTGHEACARFRRGYDVVVADLDLGPGCTGVSVLRESAIHLPRAVRVAWSGALVGDDLARAGAAAQAHVAVAKTQGRAPIADLIAAIRGALEVGR